MHKLRIPQLYSHKQNMFTLRKNVSKIMNRSTKSINDMSMSQSQIIKNTKKTHEKAFHFKIMERSKSLELENISIVNRLLETQKKKSSSSSLFRKDFSYSSAFKARQTLMKSSMSVKNLKLQKLNDQNLKTARKLMNAKSCISSREFSKDFNKHQKRSSMLSKFTIDTKKFKFIPKNQLIFKRLQKLHPITPMKNSKLRQKVNKQAIFNKYKLNPQRNTPKGKIINYW